MVSVFKTRNRATDCASPGRQGHGCRDPGFLDRADRLKPTDGIVRATAQKITRGEKSDVAKPALYDWVVSNAHREPSTAGCGLAISVDAGDRQPVGQVRRPKRLFVGLARSIGLPARDVYGIRVAPSAFGYRELGASANGAITRPSTAARGLPAAAGWVCHGPGRRLKVMRQETKEWIKNPADPLVKPVNAALFGGWEGNWVGYSHANDVTLPGASNQRVGFMMYPQALNAKGLLDGLKPETFVYTIKARELQGVA